MTIAPETPTLTAPLPPAAAAALAHAEETLAGMLAASYASAVQTCRGLSASTGWMAPGEFDRLADVQDELAMHRTRLANAGRLDLVEGAA
ncbi:hypothetical protein [Streptomyces swartbergensis]|uniref:Uncharacterized protein n=1 Tax=Streptomyces swartbergensis TaxID=487165 RepID=A0A243S708_9ACTN|nr:hypothetical protein [Streptomyces swartbergensis]OUD03323.1 hypothetical protein CA983_09955 [Streptomyces swartbergensis]